MGARHVVITGANRGLGLEFVRQHLAAGDRVAALARQPTRATELQQLVDVAEGRLLLVACDVSDDASVARARDAVAAAWDRVDRLINNAGVMGSRHSFVDLDFGDVAAVFDTNVVGPLRVTRAFLPLLRRGSAPVVIQMTSKMGSVDDNQSGGAWSYRMSKAALNMAGRNLMHEFAGGPITTALLHPGWVQTDMGGASAPLEISDAIAKLIAIIDGLTPADSGVFLDVNGETVPW